jgi:uncharacterized 2Fe-2S/4Fe-4S cluster protein (DUF4445 family)
MTMPDEHRVVFTPSGLTGTVASGATVLDAARDLGVDLDTVCGGRAICGRCQVRPVTGEFAKWSLSVSLDSLAEVTERERNYRGRRPLADHNRLGCALVITNDLVVDVPEASQIHRQVVAKSINLGDVAIDPVIRTHLVELRAFGGDTATHDEQVDAHISSVGDALLNALRVQWNLPGLSIDAAVLDSLNDLAEGDDLVETATVAVRSGTTIVGVWPGYVDRIVGAAIDVGSTTLAGHLCDLQTGEVLATAGAMNPQIRFGEDLMSRVSYVMMNDDGVADLTNAIRTGLASLIDELLDSAGLSPAALLDVVLVGNPVMHHLVLGIDPTPLGQAPFRLGVSTAVCTEASRLGLGVAPGAKVYLAPCIAGHVGADTAAAILAEGPHRQDTTMLLIDVGTNAEIVLGNRHRVFAASSPTGPAFEGAQISCGQRATVGAIERVRVDPNTLEPRFQVIGSTRWSTDPAEPDAPPVTGICGSGIIEIVAELFLVGLIDSQGVLGPHPTITSDRVVADGRTYSYIVHRSTEATDATGAGSEASTTDVVITQADVRAIQLAKAALRAGIDLLVDHAVDAGLAPIDNILLAGAFGAHIDPVRAMVLGLIPDHDPERVRAVGNAAGAGAVRALLSAQQRAEMETTAAHITKIETAVEPSFQDRFVAALGLPHAQAASPRLSAVVTLPTPSTTPTPQRRRRRNPATTPTAPG